MTDHCYQLSWGLVLDAPAAFQKSDCPKFEAGFHMRAEGYHETAHLRVKRTKVYFEVKLCVPIALNEHEHVLRAIISEMSTFE